MTSRVASVNISDFKWFTLFYLKGRITTRKRINADQPGQLTHQTHLRAYPQPGIAGTKKGDVIFNTPALKNEAVIANSG